MTPATATTETTARLFEDFSKVRRQSEQLCLPLSPEDMMVQSCAEASPAKWHLAHTTWFFETFLLREFLAGYREYNPDFLWLFNSYYNSVSDQPEKKLRASFSRPPVETIFDYRRHVQEGIERLLASNPPQEATERIVLGLHHEQQHQELLATDIKHALWTNPLRPAYIEKAAGFNASAAGKTEWLAYEGGLFDIGFAGEGFAFDNELPRHPEYLRPFELASRVVTCADYLEFINDGGYRRPELWLSAGWETVKAEGWKAPLYWRSCTRCLARLHHERRTAAVRIAANPGVPRELLRSRRFCSLGGKAAAHRSRMGDSCPGIAGHGEFARGGTLHPQALSASPVHGPKQMFGDVWEWTQSPYVGYPGFAPCRARWANTTASS
jgi:ergothioneine biosynthesis protein EgtB